MAYDLQLTRGAAKELSDIFKGISESEQRNFSQAFEALISNPYPTNSDLTPGTIVRLRGTDMWRFKVSYRYRLRYSVHG